MNAQPPRRPKQSVRQPLGASPRRSVLLGVSIALIVCGVWLRIRGGDSALAFASTSMLRIGLVVGMMWLAWPSLLRPSRWFPPGIAAVILVTLVVIAANPRLALVAVPVAGGLVTLGTVIRAFRSTRKR